MIGAAAGAPLTLATYGTGFQTGYWRTLDGSDYATLPVWSRNTVKFIPAGEAPITETHSIEELYFYFPPTAAYVRPAPEGIQVETRGQPGKDLELVAVHQRLFTAADKGEAGAQLNPGFFAGDANAQIALAAAEINAQAGKRLLTLKLGVDNLAVAGSLVNDRMRFGILSALAQASAANARYPGTVTHLVISNEYARVAATAEGERTPTQQIAEMVRYAKTQMAPGGDFAGLALKVGVRGNSFLAVDTQSSDRAARQFTQDVAELLADVDVLMENRYPSPEAVEAARQTGRWDLYFDAEQGELSKQWRQLTKAIRGLPGGERVELMIGEIGHPTGGIAFNLPGYVEGDTAIPPGSPFAKVAGALEAGGSRIGARGRATLAAYFNDALATAFLEQAFAWSRETGVQIHAFEAFDEPQKAVQNLPLPGLTPARSMLNRAGPFGAEAAYGLFGYTGVAAFSNPSEAAGPPRPGAARSDALPPGLSWADQPDGRLYPKLPDLDFAAIARAFNAVISP
ncbi:hypothetical protein [Thiocystis violacea]|uniref:hypothetical protein n=1 Tax=Thiocystis violacea TaxID=13725 RepID=UPI0019061291|nr:hypothetical protein [Thiocystis violacea]MBK1721366.1 hypothetical protein [Thiocystis violacea]